LWSDNSGEISGATSQTYTVSAATFNLDGNFTCVVSVDSLASDSSVHNTVSGWHFCSKSRGWPDKSHILKLKKRKIQGLSMQLMKWSFKRNLGQQIVIIWFGY
jgi:hypothetical protein